MAQSVPEQEPKLTESEPRMAEPDPRMAEPEPRQPDWLTGPLVISVLQAARPWTGAVEVLGWLLEPKRGWSTLSDIYRLTVEYRTASGRRDRLELVVKAPLRDGYRALAEAVDVFGRESSVYSFYLPHTLDIHWSRPTPRAYHCDRVLVLEDLQARGYRHADRLNQLDKQHCREALTSLAMFHAISVAMQHRMPELMTEADDDEDTSTDQSAFDKSSKVTIFKLIDTLKELGGCEKYIDMIEQRIDNILNASLSALRSTPGFRVLNHGEAWTENILFRYNDRGEPLKAKLIDLQLCHFGSFAYDLMVFWWTSANEEVREKHREELFELYRQKLNVTLLKMRVMLRLTEDTFQEELMKFAPFSIHVISHLLAIALEDPDRRTEPHVMLKTTEEYLADTSNYRNQYYTAVLPNILKHAEEFGAFS